MLFLLALRWGPVGIATSWSLSLCALTIPALWYAGRPIDLHVAPVIGAIWKFVVASVAAGYATNVLIGRLVSFNAESGSIGIVARIAKVSLLLGLLYIAVVILLHRGLEAA